MEKQKLITENWYQMTLRRTLFKRIRLIRIKWSLLNVHVNVHFSKSRYSFRIFSTNVTIIHKIITMQLVKEIFSFKERKRNGKNSQK